MAFGNIVIKKIEIKITVEIFQQAILSCQKQGNENENYLATQKVCKVKNIQKP